MIHGSRVAVDPRNTFSSDERLVENCRSMGNTIVARNPRKPEYPAKGTTNASKSALD
jgi:hypothetical protein